MIKKTSAFTLLEILIAMSLASFIMIGVISLYNSIASYAETMEDQATMQRTVLLLFRQMEQDLSSTYIPMLEQPVKGAGEQEKKAEGEKKDDTKPETPPKEPDTKTKEQQDKEKKQLEEQRKTFFVGQFNDRADLTKFDGKKVEAFKLLSIISTNPLLVHDEKRPRLIRIVYELAKDKTASTKEHDSFQLLRKETADLPNTLAKVDDFTKKPRELAIKTYVVASNIKMMAIEYTTLIKDTKQTDPTKQNPPQLLNSFTWAAKPELQGKVPQKIRVMLELWIDKQKAFKRFETVIPVASFPTILKKAEKNDDKDKDKKLALEKQKQDAAGKKPDSTPSGPEGKKDGSGDAGGGIQDMLKGLMGGAKQ